MIGRLTETPVTTVRVDWVCGAQECDGRMVVLGPPYMSNPPKHTHLCDKCGRQEDSTTRYPSFEHREASGEGELFSEQVKRVAEELAAGNQYNWGMPDESHYAKAHAIVLDQRLGRAAVKK
jgi:hypothetical protein